MKLTKKLENEILQVYKTWWKSYLSGDVKTYNRYLDKDYRFVGSTEAEAFLNKRDTTGFFEETADQLAGKSALRNSVLKTEQFDGLVFITELADAYLLYNKQWTFYGKFRFSSVLKKNREGWRFIYQHFSVPDSKVNEGETIGLEKITTENQELRDAIKRRTIELENKNHELKIESSLERVRAVAMGMKTREDMLRICETIARELGKLGVRDIRNVQTAIFYPERGTYMNYEYYARHKKTFVTETSYGNNRIHHAFARRMLRGKGELYKAHIRGEKKLKEWIAYQKTTNVFIDPHLRKANSLNYYWFSLGPVALGISTYNPLTNEHLVLFQRFLKVFELSYRRYLDIEKAEAQAREAQVQLALERVRARAMAMQRSGELSDLVDTVFRELTRLDFALKWCIINIIDEPNLTNTVWAANPDMSKAPESYLMKFEDYPFHHAMLKGYRDRKTNAVYILEGNEKKAYDKYLFSATEFRRVPAAAQAASRAMKRYVVNFTFSNFGGLQVVGETPLSESGIDILARFGKVFDLTYTRFNDLLKAEEQARQAEIELALERVRAKTMAMQHSDALPDAANLLFNQVQALGLPAWSAGYCIWSEDKNSVTLWMSSEGVLQPPFTAPTTEDELFIQMRTGHKTRKPLHVVEMGGKQLKAHYRYMRKLPVVGEIFDSILEAGHPLPKYQVMHYAYFSKGFLLFITYEPVPGAHDIFTRFAGVFNQTYTRFLDLKKAEAQAREAQIEAAMERVRARGMAMHKSEELLEAGEILCSEMSKLGIGCLTSGYVLIDKDTKIGWNYTPHPATGKIMPEAVGIPHNQTKELKKGLASWQKQESVCVIEMNERETIAHQTFIAEKSINFPISAKELIAISPKTLVLHNFNFREGYLLIVGGEKLNDKQTEIMLRFTRVFQQTYTRFLDLKKAEAQTREAEIELALERVRARTMAMQKSEELKEAASVLYKELRSLNIGDLVNSGYVFIDEKNNLQHAWMTHQDGTIRDAHTMPLTGDKIMNERYEKWKKGVHLVSQKLGGEELKKHHEFVLSQQKKAPENNKGLSQLPDPVIFYCGNFSKGYLHILSREELTEASESILYRFTKVFEQTYTRFLDLQKVEAQARESQIETALERIRARALAMHHSDELKDVAKVLREQMGSLGQPELETSAVHLYEEDPENILSWRAFRLSSDLEGKISYGFFKIPKKSCEIAREFTRNFKSDKSAYTIQIKGARQKEWYQVLFNLAPEVKKAMEESGSTQDPRYYHFSKFSGGALLMVASRDPSPEAMELQRRSAQVFDLAYRRFKDLQKAEAQAREARIETALEKVRSRSIGMQKSDELKEVIRVVVDQLVILEIRVDHAGFVVDYTPRGDWHFWVADKQQIPAKISHPWFDSVWARQFDEAKEKGIEFFTTYLSFEEKNKFYSDLLQYIPDLTEDARSFYFNCPGLAASNVLMDDVALYIENFSGIPYSDEENKILMRFGKVFQQTYTRFLDLQKAETQAREAQIQLALERVRARTMAMHKSDELLETSHILFEQMKELGEPVEQLTIGIIDEENNVVQVSATLLGDTLKKIYNHGIDEPYMMNKIYKAWKKQQKTLVVELGGDELNAYNKYRNKLANSEMFPTNFQEEHRRIVYAAFFSRGMLALGANEPRPPESIQLLERFASVFDLTYTRFLDLQKAEAQAREAQIEAALEKVRSRTMAMQSSNELQETAALLFQEFKKLGSEEIYQVTIGIYNEAEQLIDFRVTNWDGSGKQEDRSFYLSMDEPTVLKPVVTAWKEKRKSVIIDLSGEALEGWLNYRNKMSGITVRSADTGGRRVISIAFYSKGHLSISSPLPVPDETLRILERFAVVFDSTYTRFLDLQKAEAQAREAQVEAALERVRAKAMAMHNSEDITATVDIFFKELKNLGITPIRCGVGQIDKDTRTSNVSATTSSKQGDSYEVIGKLKLEGHPVLDNIFNHWEKQEEYYPVLKGEELTQYYRTMNPQVGFPDYPGDAVQYGSYFYFKEGLVFTWTEEALSLEAIRIFRRFTSVIGLTYRRYMDLREAEAQAREAQVEAALERIRGQAMAMRESADLLDIVVTMRTEFLKLGHEAHYFWHMRWLPEKYHKAMTSGDGTRIGMIMELPRHMHGEIPLLSAWEKSEDPTVVYVMDTDEAIAYVDKMVSLGDFKLVDPNAPSHDDIRHIQGLTFVMARTRHGEIGYSLPGRVPEPPREDISTLKRFADVFDLAYQRYEDLQKAEASTREAIKQAVLDRIRADIASMRTVEDLDRITPLIWNELTTLGVPFIRCGVFLMDDEHQQIHTFLSTPDGKAIAAFHLPYDTPGNFRNVINHWRSGNSYSDHWGEEEYIQFADILLKQGSISSTEQYLKTIPAGGFYLLFLPFQQGMLYVGNTSALDEDMIKLLQSVADAFSTAYARYEDFNKLEAAKKQVDATLVDLQQAQKQLIQSEKMASLGELTAGIAHEIQNPLNFVNNFSEVSNELIGEMLDEIEKGNFEVAREIAEDVRQNLGKIHFHGERAGGIVKGMLQHSRSSSGQKEPTDINALCDEYLRLAYHGLRAKDKTFNAHFETAFDPEIGRLAVQPQEIGRVVLNLINNAFYAVAERKKTAGAGYEPTVIVVTQRKEDKIEIEVKDNGGGIPGAVLEKIFQPFFTTKPTGQGTGLGLSLSYDIVKAHGGEIKVNTIENEGTEFIIQLPM